MNAIYPDWEVSLEMPFFQDRGRSVFYKEYGAEKPLIFLHGNTASSKLFEPLMPRTVLTGARSMTGFPKSFYPNEQPQKRIRSQDNFMNGVRARIGKR